MRRTLAVASCALFVAVRALGAPIAVIDSGLDYKHRDLVNHIWQNPNDPQDITTADGKVYKDARYGWNLAENNNQVIDYKYLGTFSADCEKIFQVQAKILQGTATQQEKDWYQQKKSDATFVKELQKFGNFVHGTHVAGISAEGAPESRVLALKLIPTETPGTVLERFLEENDVRRGADNPIAKFFLSTLAKRQAELLITAGKWVAAAKATVANGSFGTSVALVKQVIKPLLTQLLGAEPSEADTEAYAKFFVGEIITASKKFVDAAPSTLFVFAAGNDGSDNDSMPVSPANVKATNVITVAATNGTSSLASFSNWGATLVEVAAPGVAIDSTIPGDKRLVMSGTSMAAPYVTHVAGLVLDGNPALNPAGVKRILMETVDKKPFLAGKVVTGGIVNKARALRAAELSRDHALADAIRLARREVRDVESKAAPRAERDLIVLPLPSLLF